MGTNYIAPIWRMPRNANKDKLSNYSIEFDNTNANYVRTDTSWITDLGLNGANRLSVSIWLKPSSSAPTTAMSATSSPYNSWNENFNIKYDAGNTSLYFTGGNSASTKFFNNSVTLTTDQWHHVVFVFDSGAGGTAAARTRCWINNSEVANQATNLWVSIADLGFALYIGRLFYGVGGSANQWVGKISQFCIFDYALTDGTGGTTNQIEYLYNLNNPMAITGAEPVAYWPLGDNSNPNADAGYPNLSVGADSVFNFDGSSTWINVPDNDLLSFGGTSDSPFSMSAWIKTTGFGDGIISRWGNGSGSGSTVVGYEYILYAQRTSSTASTARLRLALYDQGTGTPTTGNFQRRDSVTIINTGEWVHVVATYDGRGGNGTNTDTALLGITMYINGVPESSYINGHAGSYFHMRNTSRPTEIGVYNDTSSVVFNGQISNAQIWDEELTASEALELYNNGQPLMTGTQPQESNLTAWWKLNQSANWEAVTAGKWQIPDSTSAYPQSFNFSKTPQEYIDLGTDDWFNEYNNEITFSLWVNKKDWSSTGFEGLISKYGLSGATIQYRIAYPSSAGKLQFYLQGSATSGSGYSARINNVTLTSAQQAYEWLHILWRHSASTNTSQVIFNGDHANAVSLTNIAANPYAQPQTTTTNMIGNVSNGLQPFDGAISNYQRFNTYLDNAAVEALYNEGVPSTTAIATNNLKAWYKLDNNDRFQGNWRNIDYAQDLNYTKALSRISPDNGITTAGTGDRVNCGNDSSLQITGAMSISLWFRVNTISPAHAYNFVMGRSRFRAEAAADACWNLLLKGVSYGNPAHFRFQLSDGTTTSAYDITETTNGDFFNDKWQNLIITYDGTTDANSIKAYLNGELHQQFTSSQASINNIAARNLTFYDNDVYQYGDPTYTGALSNCAIWNKKLELSDISSIWNNGSPALTMPSESQLQGWWKFSDGTYDDVNTSWSFPDSSQNNNTGETYTFTPGVVAAFDFNSMSDNNVQAGTGISSGMTEQNLVNNNVSVLNGESVGMTTTALVQSNLTRTQPFSNYSYSLDGGTEYWTAGTTLGDSLGNLYTGPISVSIWINTGSLTQEQGIFSLCKDDATLDELSISLNYDFGYYWTLNANGNDAYISTGSAPITANTWHHLLCTFEPSAMKLYVDGQEIVLSGTTTYTNLDLTGMETLMGGYYLVGAREFLGYLSNCAVWNQVLTQDDALNLYNNGVSQDLNNFRLTPIRWWSLDQNYSYWDGTNIIGRDVISGDDATGINIAQVDLEGNAPGSEASGTGSNLTIADLKGNMYNSDKNAYSINMADYADGVTNPANSGRSTDTP